VLCADVVHVVAADVEVREGGVVGHEGGEGDGAARLELVAGEEEGRERGAEHEGRGERGDAAVVEGVEAEVEVPERAEGGERGREQAHALDAHVVAAQAEVREVRGRAQRDGEDARAVRAHVAVAADAEAAEVADGEHGAQAVDAGGREEAEAGDAGAGDGGGEAVEDVRPLDGPRAREAEPEVRAHAERGGQARAQAVDEVPERLGRAAQELGVGVDPVLAPDVGGHGGEDVREGVGGQHTSSAEKKMR
jgi:hypothetical protein